MLLRLSTALSWHARGDAIFSWHRQTGDVCEMSRDVAALCLAFVTPTVTDAAARAASIPVATACSYADVLHQRAVLVDPSGPADDPRLGRWRPYAPRRSIYERDGDDVVVHGRDLSLRVSGARPLLDQADGTRRLDELVPRPLWPSLLRLCEADLAALKLLPPGAGSPPWAESTMPWPRIDLAAFLAGDATAAVDPGDLAGYHAAITDPEAQFDQTETTLSHLFREPHPALGGQRFGDRLAAGLRGRGGPGPGARVVEVGGGLGYVGAALREALSPRSYVVVDRSPALARAQRRRGLDSVVGDARSLPIADRSIDLLIANEMAGDLGTVDGINLGALALVDECARVLAPGGLAYVSEFGHPTRPPVRSDHLDHDEHSLRFEDLRARAAAGGLEAQLCPLPELIGLDPGPRALVTTRASFAGLRRLFAARGVGLAKRAWLEGELTEALAGIGLRPEHLHGLDFAPLGQRTMGLVPAEFWALLARRPR